MVIYCNGVYRYLYSGEVLSLLPVYKAKNRGCSAFEPSLPDASGRRLFHTRTSRDDISVALERI